MVIILDQNKRKQSPFLKKTTVNFVFILDDLCVDNLYDVKKSRSLLGLNLYYNHTFLCFYWSDLHQIWFVSYAFVLMCLFGRVWFSVVKVWFPCWPGLV